jgi:DNA polymerase
VSSRREFLTSPSERLTPRRERLTSRRERFLEELGLTPLWRRRGSEIGNQGSGIGDQESGISDLASRIGDRGSADALALTSPGGAPERAAIIARMNWIELRGAVKSCDACSLAKTRKQSVFGVGDEMADWLFVGEAPGADEDAKGEPFVGQAGKLLDNMLAAIGLRRGANVYIANVLKCRPPHNRNPEPFEVAQCSPHLARQVELIQPKLIVALGRFAAQSLLETDATIASLRGRLHSYRGVPTIVTYHPAYLLRSMPDKAKAWADLCFARATMRGLSASVAETRRES